MAILDRLFGRHKEEAAPLTAAARPANAPEATASSTAHSTDSKAKDSVAAALDDASSISLQLLFPGDLSLDAFVLTKRLCAFHPAMNIANVEIDSGSQRTGNVTGRARWGMHLVEFAGTKSRMPSNVVDSCIKPAHYDGAIKQDARNHQSHVRLTYAGTNPSPIDRFIALTTVAGTLGSTGAVVVLNENARASLPIEVILPSLMRGDRQEYLRMLPVHHLYAGFVELDIAGHLGVWMRTYGCQHLRMPNLAMFVGDRSQHDWVDEVFTRIFAQLAKAHRRLEADATMMISPSVCVRFREATPSEFFIHDDVFVVEVLDS